MLHKILKYTISSKRGLGGKYFSPAESKHNSSCWVRIKENIIKKIEKFFLYFVKGIKQIK